MKRGREYHSCGKNIKTGEKNIKCGKEEGELLGKKIKTLKNRCGENIKLQGTLYTPEIFHDQKVFWSVVYLRTPSFVRSCPLAGSA